MIFSGEYRFAHSAESIWRALTDPAVLRRTIPSCETIDQISETEFAATVRVAIGPMKLRFQGTIVLSDLDAPWRYTISCDGNGGLSGVAKGRAKVTMAPDPPEPGTILRYHAELALGGMVATLAEKVLAGAAKRVADGFFAAFAANIPEEIPKESPGPRTGSPEPSDHASPFQPAPIPQRGLHPVVWSAALTAITGIILALSVR